MTEDVLLLLQRSSSKAAHYIGNVLVFIPNVHVLGASVGGSRLQDQRAEVGDVRVLCLSELLEALQEKERRTQQQLDRCTQERGRKMEEQRRKEQRRRAAAEEKRRQQQEAEKVRGRR